MRQAFHILKKDIRRLWMEIGVALAAAALLILTSTTQWSANAPLPQTVGATLVSYLLPLSWWVLVVRAVHGETLVGDREFWQTRPYSWKSLLVAKALFIVAFINLPLLVAQAIIVQAHGFSLPTQLLGLLWNQVLIGLVFILPVFAVAAMTTGLVQFLVIGLIAFAATLLLSMRIMLFAAVVIGGGWRGMEWIHAYYALLLGLIAGPAILLWQYARRRTVPARFLAAAVVLVMVLGAPISWTTAFAIQSHFSRRPLAESAVRAGFYSSIEWTTRALIDRHQISLHIPLQITGIPDDVTAKTEGLTATIEAPGGIVWRANKEPWANVRSMGQLVSLQTDVDESFYQQVRAQPVSIRGYLYLTLYGNRRITKVPVGGHPTLAPGMGLCSASVAAGAPYFLSCNSAFSPRSDLVSIRFENPSAGRWDYSLRRQVSYSPFPAELSINPVSPDVAYSTYRGPLDAVTVESLEPVAYIRAPITIDDLHLAKYEAKVQR